METMTAWDCFIPEGRQRRALPDGNQNKSKPAGAAKSNAEEAHIPEILVDKYAKIQKQDGQFVEADSEFVCDLGAIKPLETHNA